MAKVKVYNLEGKVAEEIEVSDAVFGLAKNDDLVHQVAIAIYANQRQVLADTKTRGERAGSGIKPWKQKGTGRARVGSKRTPLWKKGGVVFGPNNDRNYKKKVNKKMNQKAIKLVLSGKLRDEQLFVMNDFNFSEKKTKKAAEMFSQLNIATERALLAYAKEERDKYLISRNLKNVKSVLIEQLNVSDMLENKHLVMSRESLRYLEVKYK
jgi:large subunit ribosomal protein L4